MNGPVRIAAGVCDRHFLAFAHEPAGQVHSVYEKAVNIWNGSDLYALVAGREFPAPYTANTEEINFLELGLRPEERVSGGGGLVEIGHGILLSCRDVEVFEQEEYQGREKAAALAEGILAYKRYLGKNGLQIGCADFFRRHFCGEMLPAPDCMTGALNRRLEAFVEAVHTPSLFIRRAEKLIGAGRGLTPSGDDFLCGMTAALYSCEAGRGLGLYLARGLSSCGRLQATTDVSRQMLKGCLRGEFSGPDRRLIGSFLGGGRDMDRVMKLMEKVGHSSGVDFSAGLASGYCLIHRKWDGTGGINV